MKHIKCYYCGFEAGNFSELRGQPICIECQNRQLILNNTKGSDGQLSEEGVKSIPEADTFGVQSRPEDLTVGEAYKRHGKQLKIQWYG